MEMTQQTNHIEQAFYVVSIYPIDIVDPFLIKQIG